MEAHEKDFEKNNNGDCSDDAKLYLEAAKAAKEARNIIRDIKGDSSWDYNKK